MDVPTDSTEIVDTPTPVNQLSELMSDIAGPVVMPGLISGRAGAARELALKRHGGSRQTEDAVIRALKWLKENQLADGSWQGKGSANSKTGMTGLALLTFLAHGETPSSVEYGETVQKAIRFLVEAQQEAGNFRHTEGGERGGVYANGIATYALSEAYAMTRIPMLRGPMEKGITHIIKGQREDGGFDYDYAKTGGKRDRCTSVAGWQSQALKASLMAGAEVPGLREAARNAAEGLKLNQRDDKKFLYASGRQSSEIGDRRIMTAIAVLCLQILGEGRSQEAQQGMRAINSASPEDYHNESEPVYAWYYATQAYFHTGGTTWSQWNRRFAPMVVKNQNPDGSWNWPLGRSNEYGPVYHTTFSALSLMVYYRYLPTMQTDLIAPPVAPDQRQEAPEDGLEFRI
ncbi:MAG: prenyltransferase/squalene oxidase repeat-containing protein [Kiritimatiellia bacterium]